MRHRAVVQSAGYTYRLKGQLLQEEFNHSRRLQHLLLHYTQALLTQMAQTAVCNRRHSLDQQLCRWLSSNDPNLLPGGWKKASLVSLCT